MMFRSKETVSVIYSLFCSYSSKDVKKSMSATETMLSCRRKMILHH